MDPYNLVQILYQIEHLNILVESEIISKKRCPTIFHSTGALRKSYIQFDLGNDACESKQNYVVFSFPLISNTPTCHLSLQYT